LPWRRRGSKGPERPARSPVESTARLSATRESVNGGVLASADAVRGARTASDGSMRGTTAISRTRRFQPERSRRPKSGSSPWIAQKAPQARLQPRRRIGRKSGRGSRHVLSSLPRARAGRVGIYWLSCWLGLTRIWRREPMTVITAVSLANQAGITPDKFRQALRKSRRDGAADLSWHHHNDRWEGEEASEDGRKRIESMKRVLRQISN
jgi:hypothetical protein